jgi:hypothetical protein
MRGTELHAKAASFAALNYDGDATFCHESPQLGVANHSGVSTAEDVIMRGITREWCDDDHMPWCGGAREARWLEVMQLIDNKQVARAC